MKKINGLLKHDYQDVESVSGEANMREVIQVINNHAHLLRDIYWRLEEVERYMQGEQNEIKRNT